MLYVFAISHYCEKARWALDYHGIRYRLKVLAPGRHIKVAEDLGAPASSLPYLRADGRLVHGSADVVTWSDQASDGTRPSLTPHKHRLVCHEIERRLDEVTGVHVRRLFYAEALVDYPQTVRPVFTRDLGLVEALAITLSWGKIRDAMIRRMDLGPEQREESKRIVEGELAWLDGLLADGREFLVGERLTRADVAAAALLSPLALPPEHPVYGGLRPPPLFEADVDAWTERPSMAFVRRMYREHRQR